MPRQLASELSSSEDRSKNNCPIWKRLKPKNECFSSLTPDRHSSSGPKGVRRTNGRWLETFWRKVVVYGLGFGLIGCHAISALGQVGTGLNLEAPILPEPNSITSSRAVSILSEPTGTTAVLSVTPEVAQSNFIGCTACGSIGCTGCADCGPGFQCPPGLGLWIRADYLIWYEKNMDTIPLATTTTVDPPNASPDLTLDGAETSILFGGRSLNADPLEGWRLEIGTWLNPSATYGIFGRYYEVDDREHSFRSDSSQIGALGIPFFNFDADAEDAIAIVVNEEQSGLMTVDIDGGFRAWEILFRRLAQTGCNYRMDWVYGYRNTRLYESLDVRATTEFLTDIRQTQEGTIITFNDEFDVKNQFHGFDFGVTGHSREGCWSLDFLLKVALGAIEQEVTIDGRAVNFGPLPDRDRTVLVGGLFSQETNIGKHDTTEFGVIPELNLNLGYAITPHIDFTVGYTFIYINSVLRAGTAIDRVIDEGLLVDVDPVNSNRPQVSFDDTNYHIHGLNLGVTARF